MIEEIRRRATIRPFTSPQSPPTHTPRSEANQMSHPARKATAMVTEASAIMEPTERSMFPVMMMKATTMARIVFSESMVVISKRL